MVARHRDHSLTDHRGAYIQFKYQRVLFGAFRKCLEGHSSRGRSEGHRRNRRQWLANANADQTRHFCLTISALAQAHPRSRSPLQIIDCCRSSRDRSDRLLEAHLFAPTQKAVGAHRAETICCGVVPCSRILHR